MDTLAAGIAPAHPANWQLGWGLVLCGFVVGAGLGLRFHRDGFWGGYASLPRRLARLGHVSLVALGLINVIYALSAWPSPGTWQAAVAGACMAAGAIMMPVVCFLAAWRVTFRHAFALPVVCLVVAVIAIVLGGS